MATQLSLYNGSLQVLGERPLASLSENRTSRRELDGVWSRGGVRTCLGQGQWNFAMRTVRLDASPSIEPDFGYRYAFDKPTDWVRTAGMAQDGFFSVPLLEYADEAGFWFASQAIIYARFVSDDTVYGSDLSLWPENFTRYVERYFASLTCLRITQSKSLKAEIDEKQMPFWLAKSRSTDAMDEPPGKLPAGSWSRARRGGRRSGSNDGGSSGSLTG